MTDIFYLVAFLTVSFCVLLWVISEIVGKPLEEIRDELRKAQAKEKL